MRKGFIHGNKRLIDLLNNRPGLRERVAEINKDSDTPSDEDVERNNSSQEDNR